jgi:hypothetical protein
MDGEMTPLGRTPAPSRSAWPRRTTRSVSGRTVGKTFHRIGTKHAAIGTHESDQAYHSSLREPLTESQKSESSRVPYLISVREGAKQNAARVS